MKNTVIDLLERPLVAWNGKSFASQAYDAVFARIVEADRAADAAWESLGSPEAVREKQTQMRACGLASFGGFPERTPLNARTTGVIKRKGYVIEKILFESRPKYFVTGHLFLPDSSAFKPPYPAIYVPCGHSAEGKAGFGYQRAGVQGALAGFATFVVDPTDQGERFQAGRTLVCGHGHQHSGVRAHLLGEGQAQYRIWDSMRAIDVLCERPDVDPARIGAMGMSGGGTLSSYIYAFDERVKAACPSGFLTTIRDTCQECGPQDAEQVLHGQLAAGLNHLGYMLMRYPAAACPSFTRSDFFPFRGALATFGRMKRFYEARGEGKRVAYVEAPGPHNWCESARIASLEWMRAFLNGESGAFSYDPHAHWEANAGFSYANADTGIASAPREEGYVVPGGRIMDLPGARTIYDILRDKLAEARAARPPLSEAAVRDVTGIPPLAKIDARILPVGESEIADHPGASCLSKMLMYRDGTLVPYIVFLPAQLKGRPVLLVPEASRTALASEIEGYLTLGRPVAVTELRGRGEGAGTYKRGTASFHAEKGPDEEIARMLDLLGESLVAWRTQDIARCADELRRDCNAQCTMPNAQCGMQNGVELRAWGAAAVAAAHAAYLEKGLFASVDLVRPPAPWTHAFEDDAYDPRFANTVFGAMKVYDWTDLLADIAPAAVDAARAARDVLDELLPRPRRITRLDGSAPIRYLESDWAVNFSRGPVADAPENRQEEAYTLHMSPRGIEVTAGGRLGELRARATLEQLARLTNNDDPIPACEIVDWPEIPLRGAMLDTGRNFVPLELLKDLVDHLALYKMNVFHWHLTDYFGWRLESKIFPELQSDRATARHKGCFYTQTQFRELVDYAWERGVTVVPELDVPGHSLALRRGLGVEKMREEKVRGAVSALIDELCSLAPAESMPYIHLGTDEVGLAADDGAEWVPHDWLREWAARVAANGRTLIGWWPGETIESKGPQIREVWGWAHFRPKEESARYGDLPYIDSTEFDYVNHIDPFEMLNAGAFQKPCPWGPPENRLGAMISAWHDDAAATGEDYIRQVALFAAVTLYADAFWGGRGEMNPDFFTRLPKPGTPDFAFAADLERRVVAQRDKVLAGLRHAFPYIAQTAMRWRLSLADGTLVAEDLPQATVYPHRALFDNSLLPDDEGVAILETWVRSPVAQDVQAWIGATGFARSSGRFVDGPVPSPGEWNRHGATVEINGVAIPGPDWAHPGVSGIESRETPLTDEDYFYRPPHIVRLEAGWNHIRLTLPKPKSDSTGQKWLGTFIPVLGTSDHPREVPGLVWASHPPA